MLLCGVVASFFVLCSVSVVFFGLSEGETNYLSDFPAPTLARAIGFVLISLLVLCLCRLQRRCCFVFCRFEKDAVFFGAVDDHPSLDEASASSPCLTASLSVLLLSCLGLGFNARTFTSLWLCLPLLIIFCVSLGLLFLPDQFVLWCNWLFDV